MRNFITITILTFLVLSCKDGKSQDKKTMIVDSLKVDKVKEFVEKPKITPESKLKGQFKFGMSMADKKKWSPTSRAYAIRKAAVDAVKLKFTFYGDGNAVSFLDNGSYKYMTKKDIDKATFKYYLKGSKVFAKQNDDEKELMLFEIIDESINKDYFEVLFSGKKFGLYKVGESPK